MVHFNAPVSPEQQLILQNGFKSKTKNQEKKEDVDADDKSGDGGVSIQCHQEEVPTQSVDATILPLDESINQVKDNASDGKGCAYCAKQRRVIDVTQLERGQHISMPGQTSNIHIKKTRRLKRLYHHHAIVKEVISAKEFIVEIILIHFAKCGKQMSICEQKKIYDLRETELYITDYVHPKYNADEIVERAESVLKGKEKNKIYNPVSNNCEHFATWCVVGEGESFQVQSMSNMITHYLYWSAFRINIATCIFRIAPIIKKLLQEFVYDEPELYLRYCSRMTEVYITKYMETQMCRSCLKEKLQDLWFTFSIHAVTSDIITYIYGCLKPPVCIPICILLSLISGELEKLIPKKLNALSSPFNVDENRIKDLTELSGGDVISFRYYGFQHYGIVSEVDTDSSQIQVIHYSFSSIFKKRKIIEETIAIYAQKTKVHLLNFKRLSTYPKDVVVSRARSRIGETKWNSFSNRSDHFAYWAKVKTNHDDAFDVSQNVPTPESFSRSRNTLLIKGREIHRFKELKIGDVVRSSVIGKYNNTGILASFELLEGSNGRKFEIAVITYSFSWVVERNLYTIDLNTDSLFVNIYDPAQCQNMQQRAKNAATLVKKKGKWWTTEEFIRHCIEAAPDEGQ